jgi:RND superfamily putative drug exporter
VLFAGTTVVIALLGMFIMGLSFIDSLGLGAALAVLVTVIASLTLLPAMLGFIGYNIDRFALPGLHRTAGSQGSTGGFWYRWSRHIQSRPWPFAIGALALLLVLVAPVASLRLGNPDAGNDPPGTTTRLAYDLLAKGFGPGYNGPLTVATSFSGPADLPVVERMRADLLAAHDVASVGPVVPNSKTDPTAAIISVTPKTSPESAATASWVRYIRADVLTPAVAGTDVVVHSGGSAAISIDLTHRLGGRLPWFFGAVIALSFLLLMSVFRSVLVPLKAAIMNLLSIGASFGILVAVFQWGWGASLIGVAKQPITSFSPMMLFAILFGLSMDYEVFLLSRIKEEHDRSHNNAQAVADGLAATARVITAAAAIMVTVFMTFVFQPDATAKLIGEANWWLPSWLDRVLPRLAVDGGSVAVPPSPESGSGESPERVLAGR